MGKSRKIMERRVEIGSLRLLNEDWGDVSGVRNPKSRVYLPQVVSFATTGESVPSSDDELESDEREDQFLLCPWKLFSKCKEKRAPILASGTGRCPEGLLVLDGLTGLGLLGDDRKFFRGEDVGRHFAILSAWFKMLGYVVLRVLLTCLQIIEWGLEVTIRGSEQAC